MKQVRVIEKGKEYYTVDYVCRGESAQVVFEAEEVTYCEYLPAYAALGTLFETRADAKEAAKVFTAKAEKAECDVTGNKSALKTANRADAKEEVIKEEKLVYVGSKAGKIFHCSTCRFAKKISAANYIRFKNRQEACTSGRRPCKVCEP